MNTVQLYVPDLMGKVQKSKLYKQLVDQSSLNLRKQTYCFGTLESKLHNFNSIRIDLKTDPTSTAIEIPSDFLTPFTGWVMYDKGF